MLTEGIEPEVKSPSFKANWLFGHKVKFWGRRTIFPWQRPLLPTMVPMECYTRGTSPLESTQTSVLMRPSERVWNRSHFSERHRMTVRASSICYLAATDWHCQTRRQRVKLVALPIWGSQPLSCGRLYRAGKKSLQILLSSTQAGPGRKVKQEQEEIPRNHVPRLFLGSVNVLIFSKHFCFNTCCLWNMAWWNLRYKEESLVNPEPESLTSRQSIRLRTGVSSTAYLKCPDRHSHTEDSAQKELEGRVRRDNKVGRWSYYRLGYLFLACGWYSAYLLTV